METGFLCAYNVTRTALLCEKVTYADPGLSALQLAGQLMHGPGADGRSAISIHASSIGRVPRLSAFDVLYLDQALRVLTAASVDPITDFPPVPTDARTALLLPEGRIALTSTWASDEIRICEADELTALIKTGSLPIAALPASSDQPPTQQALPVQSLSFEVIRPSHFVFEPFQNSLIYSPPLASTNEKTSEFFLPQAPPVGAEEPRPIEQPASIESPVPDATPAAPSFARPEEISRALEVPEPPGRQRSKKPLEKPGRQQEQDAPRFHQPKPIRFFDPLEAAQSESAADAGIPQEPPPPRPPNYLPPELKAAILKIDEEQRLKQSSAKAPREKATRRKKNLQAPVPTTPERAQLTPPSAVPQLPPTPASPVEFRQEAEATPAPLPETPLALGRTSPAERPLTPEEAPVETSTEQPRPVPADPIVLLEAELAPTAPLAAQQSSPESLPVPEPPPPAPPPSPAPELPQLSALTATPPSATHLDRTPEVAPPPPLPVSAPKQQVAERSAKRGKTQQPRTKQPRPKPSIAARLSRWLEGAPILLDGQRRAERHALPGLVAFYWTGGTPQPHEIVNISRTGFYLRTRDLWSPNTLLRMTLQRHDSDSESQESLSILARVVRIDDEGVGHEFVSNEALLALHTRDLLPKHGTDMKALKNFLNLS